jgi:hypothetical protein
VALLLGLLLRFQHFQFHRRLLLPLLIHPQRGSGYVSQRASAIAAQAVAGSRQ